MLTISAYAKITLTLEVLGRRADGYHEVATVLQAIDLRDTLCFEEQQGISLHCDHPSLGSLDNLAVRAAMLLQASAGSGKGASISLKKGIPIAAGLGGGATDAAVTLRALDELWELGLSLDQLLPLASRVSSDAAFFLYGGTALGQGRGERITPLPSLPPSWVVLLKPDIDVPYNKTERLYASLNPSHFSQGQFSERMVELLHQGGEIPSSSLFNTFEGVAFAAFPGLEGYWQRFSDRGADNIHLAGSGPTLFTLVKDKSRGEELYSSLKREGMEAYLVQTVARP
ncbi:MAG: 4-(cytidine 5'-diphospho)-2-C-methyl-D-erythritol kinase [Dehalococcoidia bacterium]